MKSYAFLFWAYNVIWLSLAVYIAFVMARIGKVSKRIEAMERALSRKDAAAQRSSDS
jgi:CcmD family protein